MPAGTTCPCVATMAAMTAMSARTRGRLSPRRQTRQAKAADQPHSTVSTAASHRADTPAVAAIGPTMTQVTALLRRSAMAARQASLSSARSDGPAGAAGCRAGTRRRRLMADIGPSRHRIRMQRNQYPGTPIGGRQYVENLPGRNGKNQLA